MDASQGLTLSPKAGFGPLDQTLCACGSGLRTVRCCRLDPATLPDPAYYGLLAGPVKSLGDLRAEGKNREAARLAVKILDLAPLLPDGLRVLFDIRLAEGQNQAALALAARLALIEPDDEAALGRYAGLLAAQEQYAKAVEIARQGLLRAPRLPVLHQVLGMCLTELGALQEGEQHYLQALALQPAEPVQIRVNLAWNLNLQGRLEEAAALYDELRAEGVTSPRMLTSFAQVEAKRGRLDVATALLEEVLACTPHERLAALLWAVVQLQQGRPDAALARLARTEAALAPQKLGVTEQMTRGRALEQRGDYQQAWAAYQAGREAQRQHRASSYDPAGGQARLAALKATFQADRLAALARPDPAPHLPRPVFLLGVPRSGTSLLEHLLTQLPQINPADQHGSLPALARLLPALAQGIGGAELAFPEALTISAGAMGREIPTLLARRYMEGLLKTGVTTADTPFVTDRHADLPWLLGLGISLFPDAPVIHLLRHPLDVILSGFAQDTLYEGDAGLTLASLAHSYDLKMQAIAHIRGQMTLRYLPVRYEDLVTSPVATMRRIYQFIGLSQPVTKNLFTAPPRFVPRRPAYSAPFNGLHQQGLYRHRPFGPVFGEAMSILAPWIERLGYQATGEMTV